MSYRSRYLIPFIVLFFSILSSFVCDAQTTGIQIIDDGLNQMKKENYARAKSIFLAALTQYPNNASVYYNLGIAYEKTKMQDSSIFCYTRAINLDNAFTGAYINRSFLYYKMKDSAKGDADARKALTCKPAVAEAYANWGYMLMLRGKSEGAIKYFDSAIAINKYFYQAYTNKAGTLAKLGQYYNALEIIDYLISIKPTNIALAYYNRANIYFELGELVTAYEECEKAIQLDNKDGDSYILRSKIKDVMGDDQSAVEDCTIAIGLDSTNAEYYKERAVRRFDLNEYEAIIDDCNKALALSPNDYQALVQRGDAYDDLGKFDEAIRDYDKAIALQSSTFVAYRERAGTAYKLKDYQGALKFINKALSIQPNDKYMLGHKYNIYLHNLNDVNAALTTLDQCIKQNTDSTAIFYLMVKTNLYDSLKNHTAACKTAFEAIKLGSVDAYEFMNSHGCNDYKNNPRMLAFPLTEKAEKETAAGNYVAMVKTYTEMIKLLPDTAALYLNRGMAYRKLDKFEEAAADYTKAISLNPKLTQAIICRAVAKGYLADIEGAKKDYLLAIKTDPANSSIAYHNYALCISETEPEKAVEYFTNAIRIDMKYAKAYCDRGLVYIQLNRKEEACRDFDRAYQLGMLEAKAKSLLYCR